MIKILGAFVMFMFFGLAFSQSISTTVQSEMNYGDLYYYYLREVGTEQLFKTSAFYTSEFYTNQEVELEPREIYGQFDIVSPVTEHQGIATKINNIDNSISAVVSRLDLPIFENEILFFRDTTHLYRFQQQIADIDENIAYEIEDFDDVLEELELYFEGYYSFRSYLNDKYDIVYVSDEDDEDDDSGMTDDDFLAFEEEDFIADPVQRVLFNRNRLIGIGEMVYYYHDLNEIVSTHKENIDEVEMFKDVSTSLDFDLLNSTSKFRGNPNINFEKNAKFTNANDDLKNILRNLLDTIPSKGLFFSPNYDEAFISDPFLFNIVEDCNPFLRALDIAVFRQYKVEEEIGPGVFIDVWYNESDPYNLNNKNATLIIDWGDDTPVQTINNYYGQKIYHNYDDKGTYYPSTQLMWSEPGYTVLLLDGGLPPYLNSEVPLIFVVDEACTKGEDAKWNHKEMNNWRLRSKIWISNNVFGKHVGSYTQGFRKKSDKWVPERSKVRTTIFGNFRNSSCEIVQSKWGEKTRNNRKQVSKIKTKHPHDIYRLSNGDVFSTHRLEKGNIDINHVMILNPCD